MLATLLILSSFMNNEPDVRVYGALRPIMHEDKREGRVRLGDAAITKQSVGLGVVEGLDGEITIIDGVIYVDRVRQGKIERDKSPATVRAALLAVADVSEWKSIRVNQRISADKVDEAIEGFIKKSGLDVTKRIPIKIQGKFSKLTAHVIDGTKIPAGNSSHEIHMNSGIKLDGVTEEGTVTGFFTKSDAGVLTHHSTSTHFHISLANRRFAGHVDSMSIESGSVVMLGIVKR